MIETDIYSIEHNFSNVFVIYLFFLKLMISMWSYRASVLVIYRSSFMMQSINVFNALAHAGNMIIGH